MPTSDVLQMYLQENYQCQGKYKGYKHQYPFGKHKSYLSHEYSAPMAGKYG